MRKNIVVKKNVCKITDMTRMNIRSTMLVILVMHIIVAYFSSPQRLNQFILIVIRYKAALAAAKHI